MIIDLREEQSSKALSGICVSLLEMSTVCRDVQPQNIKSPIFFTEFGIVMFRRDLQPQNAILLIIITEFGILTDWREAQSEKALCSISFTVFGILMVVTDLSFTPLRMVPVSSRIRFGAIMVIMDLVYAKVMKKNEVIADGGSF